MTLRASNKIKILAITIAAFLLNNIFPIVAYAAEVDKSSQNAEKFGILTLLPPLIAIVLAFMTKNVVISLFSGIFIGGFILNLSGFNIFSAIGNSFLDVVSRILNSLGNTWNAGIILQCLTIGGVIALVSKMGGGKAVAEKLSQKAKGRKSAQIYTWIMALCVFFDDYANTLIVGPIMRPVCDKMKVSREKLAFLVDSTAAPVVGMALVSTWVGLEVSLLRDAFSSIGVDADPYGVFVQTIPYRFYNILILVFILLTIITGREFGSMYKAERRTFVTGKLSEDDAKPMVSEEDNELEPKSGIKLSIWNAIIPILTLIIGSFAGFYYNGYKVIMSSENSELITMLHKTPFAFRSIQNCFGKADASIVIFQAALLATIIAIVMGVSKKLFTLTESIEIFISGAKSLIMTAVILLLAWSLSSVIKDLGTAKYLVNVLSGTIPKFLLPALIFILASIISFSTGTSYGTMGILMPLTIPLAYSISAENTYILMSAGAILTGSIFGDHCSPISDTTILSSMGAACDHLHHTRTQMPYALFVAFITIVFGYIPMGLGLSVYLSLPLSIIFMAVILFIIGKPVCSDENLTVKDNREELEA